MVHEPQSLFRKYGLDTLSVPQDSRPVEITPGIMIIGWWALRPSARALRPTEKASYESIKSRSPFCEAALIQYEVSGPEEKKQVSCGAYTYHEVADILHQSCG